jgi:hypothetical protein
MALKNLCDAGENAQRHIGTGQPYNGAAVSIFGGVGRGGSRSSGVMSSSGCSGVADQVQVASEVDQRKVTRWGVTCGYIHHNTYV